MSRRRLARILQVISLALLGWLIVGSASRALYERAEVRVPDYPNATNVQVTPLPVPDGLGTASTTTFETVDNIDTVLAFYRAQLTPRGLQHWDYFAAPDGTAIFSREGCPAHTLTVQTVGDTGGRTAIRLNHTALTRC